MALQQVQAAYQGRGTLLSSGRSFRPETDASAIRSALKGMGKLGFFSL